MIETHALFLPCPRGLEEALVAEIARWGLAGRSVPGGVEAEGGWRAVYETNLRSRLASRVLWRLAQGPYATEDDVYRLTTGLAWEDWFGPDQTLRVDVTATRSPLRSLEFITLRIKDAVCDRMRAHLGRRPSVDTRHPDVRVFAYLTADHCSLYLDTSGEPLFKRGWRLEAGEAPLRENLAAGLLALSDWSPGQALLDPMCGSGTIIVEAAQWARGIAPGAHRSFGFEHLRGFAPALWHEVQSAAAGPVHQEALALLRASDVSGDAMVQTRANLVRAGIDEEVATTIAPKQIDARQVKPHAASGLIVTNPPYGERIAVRGAFDPDQFFTEFGNALKQRFAGWQCYILSSDMALQKRVRLAPARRTPLFNGAIECRLYRFDLVAGSARKPAAAPTPTG